VDAAFVIEFCPVSCGVCDIHLDARDLDLGIGMPQQFQDPPLEILNLDLSYKEARNRVRSKVQEIRQYIENVVRVDPKYTQDAREACKLGFDNCAMLALLDQCSVVPYDTLEEGGQAERIAYGCAAACGTCDHFIDSEKARTIARNTYAMSLSKHQSKHQAAEARLRQT
jgi:hypothetical protein